MHPVSEQNQTQRRQRRRFSAPLKSDLVMQCRQGNASVAAIAQAHDIHAHMLRRWVRDKEPTPENLEYLHSMMEIAQYPHEL